MKNKLTQIIFIAVCFIICIIPFACMSFARTDSTTENKRLKELPELYNDGINFNYFKDLGAYFEDHFAFRNVMVNTDSCIQGDVFNVSNMDTVVKGDNGWLYYSDTLNDFLMKSKMSERGIYNIANNIDITQSYVEGKGADFIFTIAPNKNSLYGDNMPYYYSKKAGKKKNIDSLLPILKRSKIKYTDLFSLFKGQREVLYLKRDSHWNNKGAALVYNEIMNSLNRSHNDYITVMAKRTKTEYGDLNKMLYPLSAQPEWNSYYQYDYGYKYVTETESVEDPWIETESKKGNGKLLMFRDSFGNTLLPFFAEEFKKAYFSKETPYPIDEYINAYAPDCVVVEKVERNIDELASRPPVLTGINIELKGKAKSEKTRTTLNAASAESNTMYYEFSGIVDEKYIETYTDIYVVLTVNGKRTSYKAFSISDKNGDNGFLLYVPKKHIKTDGKIAVDIITDSSGILTNVKSESYDLNKIK